MVRPYPRHRLMLPERWRAKTGGGRAAQLGKVFRNKFITSGRGKNLTLWVNGAVTCEYGDCGLEKGSIGLEGKGYRIELRNLKVKELRNRFGPCLETILAETGQEW